jgi:hypothetical protein
VWNAAEAGPGGGLEGIIPSWITDLGWIGMAIIAVWAFATNKVYTSGQVEKLLDAERKVTEVWKQNAEADQVALANLVQVLEPIAAGNDAVLKAIEGLRQSRERGRRQ